MQLRLEGPPPPLVKAVQDQKFPAAALFLFIDVVSFIDVDTTFHRESFMSSG